MHMNIQQVAIRLALNSGSALPYVLSCTAALIKGGLPYAAMPPSQSHVHDSPVNANRMRPSIAVTLRCIRRARIGRPATEQRPMRILGILGRRAGLCGRVYAARARSAAVVCGFCVQCQSGPGELAHTTRNGDRRPGWVTRGASRGLLFKRGASGTAIPPACFARAMLVDASCTSIQARALFRN